MAGADGGLGDRLELMEFDDSVVNVPASDLVLRPLANFGLEARRRLAAVKAKSKGKKYFEYDNEMLPVDLALALKKPVQTLVETTISEPATVLPLKKPVEVPRRPLPQKVTKALPDSHLKLEPYGNHKVVGSDPGITPFLGTGESPTESTLDFWIKSALPKISERDPWLGAVDFIYDREPFIDASTPSINAKQVGALPIARKTDLTKVLLPEFSEVAEIVFSSSVATETIEFPRPDFANTLLINQPLSVEDYRLSVHKDSLAGFVYREPYEREARRGFDEVRNNSQLGFTQDQAAINKARDKKIKAQFFEWCVSADLPAASIDIDHYTYPKQKEVFEITWRKIFNCLAPLVFLAVVHEGYQEKEANDARLASLALVEAQEAEEARLAREAARMTPEKLMAQIQAQFDRAKNAWIELDASVREEQQKIEREKTFERRALSDFVKNYKTYFPYLVKLDSKSSKTTSPGQPTELRPESYDRQFEIDSFNCTASGWCDMFARGFNLLPVPEKPKNMSNEEWAESMKDFKRSLDELGNPRGPMIFYPEYGVQRAVAEGKLVCFDENDPRHTFLQVMGGRYHTPNARTNIKDYMCAEPQLAIAMDEIAEIFYDNLEKAGFPVQREPGQPGFRVRLVWKGLGRDQQPNSAQALKKYPSSHLGHFAGDLNLRVQVGFTNTWLEMGVGSALPAGANKTEGIFDIFRELITASVEDFVALDEERAVARVQAKYDLTSLSSEEYERLVHQEKRVLVTAEYFTIDQKSITSDDKPLNFHIMVLPEKMRLDPTSETGEALYPGSRGPAVTDRKPVREYRFVSPSEANAGVANPVRGLPIAPETTPVRSINDDYKWEGLASAGQYETVYKDAGDQGEELKPSQIITTYRAGQQAEIVEVPLEDLLPIGGVNSGAAED